MKTFKEEFVRKVFHLLSVSFVSILVIFFDPFLLKVFIFPIATVFFVMDFFNLHLSYSNFPPIKFLLSVSRAHEIEKYRISGSTWLLISLSILLLFKIDKRIIGVAFFILAISDSISALIGMKLGITKLFGKSLEGWIAFFVSAVIICIFFLKLLNLNVSLNKILICCFFTSFAELIAKKIRLDDNFLIPIVFSILMSIL